MEQRESKQSKAGWCECSEEWLVTGHASRVCLDAERERRGGGRKGADGLRVELGFHKQATTIAAVKVGQCFH
jgi:hypothetical protein